MLRLSKASHLNSEPDRFLDQATLSACWSCSWFVVLSEIVAGNGGGHTSAHAPAALTTGLPLRSQRSRGSRAADVQEEASSHRVRWAEGPQDANDV
jgi:hypothetical protein